MSQDDPFSFSFFFFLSQAPAVSITTSAHNTDTVLTAVLFRTVLSNASNVCEVKRRKTVGGWLGERAREAERVEERVPTDTVNKLSQALF